MTEQVKDLELKQVEEFWNANLCGNHFIKAKFPSPDFFEQYRIFRYKKTHHLDVYVDWKSALGKDVLEIGLGIGADGTRWAQHAKSYTGVDLTSEAVKATQKHFELLGLKGNIMQGNAEALKLKDSQFDIVYSHGVLHHTPDINKTFEEIYRVMKPGGQFIVMLYSKGSFNYWVRIQTYFRLRMIFEILKSKFGFKSNTLWKQHIGNFKIKGWKYLSWNNFPHHCTDGPNCEIANTYYIRDIKWLLERTGFSVEKIRKGHFPIGGHYPAVERWLAGFMGFHTLAWARKK